MLAYLAQLYRILNHFTGNVIENLSFFSFFESKKKAKNIETSRFIE